MNTEITIVTSGTLDEGCRAESPQEMDRGICKGICGCRDTWADWIDCGVGFDFELLRQIQDYDRSGRAVGSSPWSPTMRPGRLKWA